MSTFNKDALRGFLYCLHLQRTTVKSAYAKLLRTTGQEVFSLEYIQELFKKIEDGEYDMKYEDPKLQLSNMPEHINDTIIGNLDFKTRQIFRTTSTQFRDLVDNAKLHIDKLTIRLHEEFIELICDDEFRMRYHSIDKFRLVLNVIFRNKKITIKSLNVKKSRNSWKLYNSYSAERNTMEMLKEVLSSLKHHVKVETLSMIRLNCFDESLDILPYLDSQIVKNVKIYREEEKQDYEVFEPENDLFESDQWKNLESFTTNRQLIDENVVEHFSHISNVKVGLLNALSINEVMEMKEKLLNNPKLRQMKIETEMTKEDFIEINNQLRTFNMAATTNPSWAHFQYPNTSNKRLSLCVTDKLIWFKGACFVEDEPEEDDDVDEEEVVRERNENENGNEHN